MEESVGTHTLPISDNIYLLLTTLKESNAMKRLNKLLLPLLIVVSAIGLTACGVSGGSVAQGCQNPINPSMTPTRLKTETFDRDIYIVGCADRIPENGLPILFGFHGGGEAVVSKKNNGFLNFTSLANLGAIVIAPVGNVSNNGHSWINAFPWMKSNPANELLLPQQIIRLLKNTSGLPRIDYQSVHATGKSDGSGMTMYWACNMANSGVNLKSIVVVSGAYFGLSGVDNIGRNESSICVPKAPIPMLMMHGTKDQVMPYNGQNFINSKAVEFAQEYWTTKDPTVAAGRSNTYTAKIETYREYLAKEVNKCSVSKSFRLGTYSTVETWSGCLADFNFITIDGGNHVWTGHINSGPDSGQTPNMDFNATEELAKFLKLPLYK
jgi:poly(3-hydroxybutyrate) depolymerase